MNIINLRICRYLFLFLVIICFVPDSYCQKEGYNGVFGTGVGLNFNVNPPEVFLTKPIYEPYFNYFDADEGVATISDPNGKLLFYTDGETIWNNGHHVMRNGYHINNVSYAEKTTTQSAIVRIPQNPFLYYVFTVGHQGGDLKYTLVDMRMENGLGAVVFKDSLIYRKASEKAYVIKNETEDALWLLSHEYGSNVFRTFKITENGLDTVAVKCAVGEIHKIVPRGETAQGYLKGSRDGTRLASVSCRNIVEMFHFDRSNGIISDPVTLFNDTTRGIGYGVEFSPDNSKLYISFFSDSGLYQYDLNAGNIHDIINSEQQIWNSFCGSLQLGPDGNIYVVGKDGEYLDVIDDPNEKGTFCNYIEKAVYLKGGRAALGLPEFIYDLVPIDIHSSRWCTDDSVRLGIHDSNLIKSIKWDFDDPASGVNNFSDSISPVHLFTLSGVYNVKAEVTYALEYNNTFTYEEHVEIFKTPVFFLGNDTVICNGGTIILKGPESIPELTLLWKDDSYEKSYLVKSTGPHWLTISNSHCHFTDTLVVSTLQTPFFNVEDTSLCVGQSVDIRLSSPYTTFYWNDGFAGNERTLTETGKYSIMGKNKCGIHTDDLNIFVYPRLNLDLGKDTVLCHDGVLHLNVSSPFAFYKWSDNSTNETKTLSEEGTHWVEVTNKCEVKSDTLNIRKFSIEDLFIPNLITPNGDNFNETFVVDFPIKSSSLTLVNRWGQQIYYADEYNDNWPSGDVTEGVYYYFLHEKCIDRNFKGWVEVIR